MNVEFVFSTDDVLLFCLAHAGGSTTAYEKLRLYLSPALRFIPLELSGHMRRSSEPLHTSFEDVIFDLTKKMCTYIDNSCEKYALFGHSLGAVLAYHLYFALKENEKTLPTHIIFSGRWPPYVEKKHTTKHPVYIIDSIVDNNPELNQYFKQIINADLELLSNMPLTVEPEKIDSEISVLWGTSDVSMDYKDVKHWREAANNLIHFYPIHGDHFYPVNNRKETALCINQILAPYNK